MPQGVRVCDEFEKGRDGQLWIIYFTSCQILLALTVLSIELRREILLGKEIPQLNKEAKTTCTT